MNRKFFQLRQMTRNLDDTFREDEEIYSRTMDRQYEPNQIRLENDKQVLAEWEIYKKDKLETVIATTLTSECFKICICEFTKKKKITMEFWIKVAYDVFYDEQNGKEVRRKFWRSMRAKAGCLELELKYKKWPNGWKYLEKEPCLNLELLKLYEQYQAIRPFVASKLNTMTKITCDIRRMPILKEDKSIKIDMQKSTWFPPIEMGGPAILEQLTNSDNLFCDQLIKFIMQMKDIMFPVLDYFKLSKKRGRVVNLYGYQHDFILEVLYSLKACCGQKINFTQGSLKIKKDYKCANSYKINENVCSIMLTTLSQADITQEVLTDIQNNNQSEQGYSAFVQQTSTYYTGEKNKRLVFIFSDKQLNFRHLKTGIYYYKIPNQVIDKLISSIDYQFLIYYSNIMFNKCMIVQQNCSSRKPFYQIMICMWTYVLAVYFSDEMPNLAQSEIFHDVSRPAEEVEIDLGLISESEIAFDQDSQSNSSSISIDQTENTQKNLQQQINSNEDCIIVEDKPKKYIKL